jgi:hypothetical protein
VDQVYVTVGHGDSDIVGKDHRAVQAAVDFVATLGGGVVELGAGVFLMGDSLHLRDEVVVRGQGEATVLRKCDGSESPLVLDGDYGEEQITVADPGGFSVGGGVTVTDDRAGGFHTTVRTIIGADGNTFQLNGPLVADYMVSRNARAQTTFPVISGYHIGAGRIEDLAIEGNKDKNPLLTGCRGACIFLYRSRGVQILNCRAEGFNGDGISFQQSDDILVQGCRCAGNTVMGLHPGSGSQRPTVRDCRIQDSGRVGLYLCWRVRHGTFERNYIARSGEAGISIGHKDTDNLFLDNSVVESGLYGVYFRPESEAMGGHRNRLEGNRIQNNGNQERGYGVYIDGETQDISLVRNLVGDSRPRANKRQRVGIYIGPNSRCIGLDGNNLAGNAESAILDQRV